MSIMISNMVPHSASDRAQASAAAEDTKKTSGVHSPDETKRVEDTAERRPRTPVMDEYIPEEKPEPADTSKEDKKAETCTGNTDKVDREIEKLKKKQAELEQQLNAETDERKIKQLESQLAQVERELRQKDNDTYRRQHTRFSNS